MISIVIPVYRVEKYLNQCIESVINQTFQDIEIILVDDGSPDNCGKICDSFALQDKRIFVIHKSNGGLSDARNAGIEMARGEYIAFVDGDDYIHPDMYRCLYKNIVQYKADISICEFQEVAEEESEFIECSEGLQTVYRGKDVMERLYFDNTVTVVAWNKLYKRKIFEQIRYPKNKLHEDEFVIHKILDKAKTTVHIQKKLYYYRQRKGSIMSSTSIISLEDGWSAYREREKFLEKRYPQMYQYTRIHELIYIIKMYNVLGDSEYKEVVIQKELLKIYDRIIGDKQVLSLLDDSEIRTFRLFRYHPYIYDMQRRCSKIYEEGKRSLKDFILTLIRRSEKNG